MKPLPFSLELKKRVSPDAWPRLLTALRQDPWIWTALESTDLGQRALETLAPDPDGWTPAALGLLVLGGQIQPADLTAHPMAPIQAEGCAPMVESWKKGLEKAEPVLSPKTRIETLATGDPGRETRMGAEAADCQAGRRLLPAGAVRCGG